MWTGCFLLLSLYIWQVSGQVVCNNEVEEWDYVEVRPGAHMFYWFYETYHPDGPANRPLVLWLQGGPGGSSVGYGNFDIIGPYYINFTPRNTTWVNQANVLFVDSPVGTGYSYVEDPSLYTNTTEETVDDLLTFIQDFFQRNPGYRTNPFYIFGQSYGGKIAAALAQRFYYEIQAGALDMNLAGFAMGNAWVHPVDSTTNWGEFLYWMSNLDEKDQARVDTVAQACKAAADAGDWYEATDLWRETEYIIWDYTNYIDFYNVLKYVVFDSSSAKRGHYESEEEYQEVRKREMKRQLRHQMIHGSPESFDELDDIMNGEVKQCLEQSVEFPENLIWGGQSDDVFLYQEGDFMKPVVDSVGDMLQNTDLDVIVYQGQLDLICLTAGAMNWVRRLEPLWDEYETFYNKERVFINDINKQTDLIIKSHNNFKFYHNILAGHAVPKDDGEGAYVMLDRILNKIDT